MDKIGYSEKTLEDYAKTLKKMCNEYETTCYGCPFFIEDIDCPQPWCKIGYPLTWELETRSKKGGLK